MMCFLMLVGLVVLSVFSVGKVIICVVSLFLGVVGE